MNFYYDIELNFLDNNYMYYEWLDTDNVKFYKKIPLFYVSNKVIKDIVKFNIKVNEDILSLIKNFENIAIFCDKYNALALKFNNDGISIKRSFLKPRDEIDIIDMTYTLTNKYIDYTTLNELKKNNKLRMEENIVKFITDEINSIIENKDYIKLKYLYMEWFNESPSSDEELINTIKLKLNNLSIDDINMYNLIKSSIK